MDLKYKNAEQRIEGAELPNSFKISLSKRGKTVINHRYLKTEQELQILCSSCNEWHAVFQLQNNNWININETYKICNQGKIEEYFDSYCNQCYANKSNKERSQVKANKEEVSNEIPIDRVQRTVFFTKENDRYIQLFSVMNGKKKNLILNEIINEYRKNHQLDF